MHGMRIDHMALGSRPTAEPVAQFARRPWRTSDIDGLLCVAGLLGRGLLDSAVQPALWNGRTRNQYGRA